MKPRAADPSLESVINASHDGILVTDASGCVEFANPASCRFLGRPEARLRGVPLSRIIPPKAEEEFLRFWDALVEGRPSHLTLERTGSDGVRRTLLVQGNELDATVPARYFFNFRDMTNHVHMERELREEKDRAQRYLQIAGVMIVAIDPNQRVVLANRRTCETLGHPEEHILGRNWFDEFVPAHHRDRVQKTFVSLMRGELDIAEYFENPVLLRGGAERLIAWHNKLVYDDAGHIIGTISSGTDITERKKAEEELRKLNETLEQRVVERTAVAEEQAKMLRTLTRELIHAELRERRRIAAVLHEHFQQLLVAARMNLGHARRGSEDPGLLEILDGTDGILRDAIESSRTLAVELCPPTLYELGLVPALEWLGKRMREHHQLEVQIDARLDEEPDDLDLRSFCFEAVRELLFNVVKHAGVRTAWVSLQRKNDHLQIEVSDPGVGFDPEGMRPASGDSLDFGLFSIRERLTSLGGWIELDSMPGRGARVTLFAPLRSPAK